jgi:hypothetical protein
MPPLAMKGTLTEIKNPANIVSKGTAKVKIDLTSRHTMLYEKYREKYRR